MASTVSLQRAARARATKDRALRAHARRQHGLFTLAQAIAAGYSRPTISRRLRCGEWEEVAPRVYRVAVAPRLTWLDRTAAAALSVDGVASGRSAAALYGLLPPPPTPEILVPREWRSRERDGLGSTCTLPSSDVAIVRAVRATMPARTLITLAGDVSHDILADVVDTAVIRRLVRPAGLERRARELQTAARPGCGRVLSVLASQHPQLERARSEWEARVLRLIREFGLSEPEVNYPVTVRGERRLLDVAWPEPMVFVEFDGFRSHMVRKTFDDDRVRQNDLVDVGWKPFRLTSRVVEVDPERAFAPIVRAVLGET